MCIYLYIYTRTLGPPKAGHEQYIHRYVYMNIYYTFCDIYIYIHMYILQVFFYGFRNEMKTQYERKNKYAQ